MSGLCGWSGRAADPAPQQTLDAMTARLVRSSAQIGRGRAEAEAGLFLAPGTGHDSVDTKDSLWVALTGYPRWLSHDLVELAARRGHRAALNTAYRRHGTELLRHLHGAFSLAVLDRAARRALLAIDRFGVQTMYYACPGDVLVFGSTPSAVGAHPAVTSTVSPQALLNYLYYSVIPSPNVIYQEQSKLLPAQYLLYESGQIDVQYYWQMPYSDPGEGALPELADELMQLLRQAVRRATDGDDPDALGAFLSGGLDSSTVAGLLTEVTGRPTKTFTVSFGHELYDELDYARAAARHFRTEQHECELTPRDVLKLVPRIAEAFDEPFGNSSAVPAYYCANLAREHGVRTLLAGDGGDELFGGNKRYLEQLVFDAYRHIPRPMRSSLIEPVLARIPGGDRVRPVRRMRSYIARARTPMPERMETYNFHIRIPPTEVFEPDILAAMDLAEPMATRRATYNRPGSASVLQRMLHLDLKVALADNDLRKVNRMCELAQVGVRYPFFDEELAEFSARVPARLLIKRLRIRHFYKQALKGFLPQAVLGKHKHGFGMPFGMWTREDIKLRQCAYDCLLALRARAYFRPAFIDRVIEEHGKEESTAYDGLAWDLMMLELWLQRHLRAWSTG